MGLLAQHPYIVTVYDGGAVPGGSPFLVMEFLAGGSLQDRLRRDGPAGFPQVLDVGVKIAGALETAHRAGVLHRDVKPANILLSPYGDPPAPRPPRGRGSDAVPVAYETRGRRRRGGPRARGGRAHRSAGHRAAPDQGTVAPTAARDAGPAALQALLLEFPDFAPRGYQIEEPPDTGIATIFLCRRSADEAGKIEEAKRTITPGLDGDYLLDTYLARFAPGAAATFLDSVRSAATACAGDDTGPPQDILPPPGSEAAVRVTGPDVDQIWARSGDYVVAVNVRPGLAPDPDRRPRPGRTGRGQAAPWHIVTGRGVTGRGVTGRAGLASVLAVLAALLAGCATVPGSAAPVPASAQPGESPVPSAAEPAPLMVAETGYTLGEFPLGAPRLSYAVTLRNPNPDVWFASLVGVTVSFLDADGRTVASDRRSVPLGIRPGATSAVANRDLAILPDGVPATLSARVDSVEWLRVEEVGGEVRIGPATTRPDRTDPDLPGLVVDCEVTSTLSGTLVDGLMYLVYRDPVGTIIGGLATDTTIDFDPIEIPSGVPTPLQFYDDDPPQAGVPVAECHLGGFTRS